jgi:hypothetical protein
LYLLPAPIGDRLEDLAVVVVKQLRQAQYLVFEERGGYPERLAALDMLAPDAVCVYLTDPEAINTATSWLQAGHSVTLTASSGLPCFVDPGGALVDWALDQGPSRVRVEPLGVSSALDAILCVSGVNLHSFHFAGHLPEHVRWPRLTRRQRVPIALYVRGEALPALARAIDALPGSWRLTLGEALRTRGGGQIVRHTADHWAGHPALVPRPGRDLVAFLDPVLRRRSWPWPWPWR